jgi:hypothetical protein
MKAHEFVKSLFKDYEETPALRDFMEEIQRNLEDRIASLVKKGMPEEEALARASSELGDISALADEMSLKRRQEVYQDAYLGIQRYMKPPRVAAYVLFGAALAFGIISALIVYFSSKDKAGTLGTLLPFFTASVAGFTFLGLTQEDAANYPMEKRRAAWYTLAAGLIAFGVVLFPLTFFAVSQGDSPFFPFMADWGLIPALGTQIPFVIPGMALLVFLCLTEKSRLKPWAAEHYKEMASPELWQSPGHEVRFGLFSGALWIFTMGLFIALGFAISFKYSWLVFIFATAAQLLIQALLFKPEDQDKK